MPIATECTAPGCKILTMGALCVEHDVLVTRVFVRGRPWNGATAAPVAITPSSLAFAPGAWNARRAWARREAARALR
jgi:hypothetical protein